MRSPIDDEIRGIFDQCSGIGDGQVATYIPELAAADPSAHGLCVMSVEGHCYAYGAVDVPFTIQSISKIFAYALALETRGFDAVDALIDVEPSGEAFNELSLDSRTHRPRNPMINAGAITASSLLPGSDPEQQLAGLLDYLGAFVDHPLAIDERVYASEARDRAPEPGDRPPAARRRRAHRRPDGGGRRVLPAVLDPGHHPRPRPAGRDPGQRRRPAGAPVGCWSPGPCSGGC